MERWTCLLKERMRKVLDAGRVSEFQQVSIPHSNTIWLNFTTTKLNLRCYWYYCMKPLAYEWQKEMEINLFTSLERTFYDGDGGVYRKHFLLSSSASMCACLCLVLQGYLLLNILPLWCQISMHTFPLFRIILNQSNNDREFCRFHKPKLWCDRTEWVYYLQYIHHQNNINLTT